ncbi:hypothetical protein PR048_017585 [Dryococelus australis]|uniref:Uncharacterized protein n=1 Tax=Dryococelus australis TaxID=614101 RepID=A0ABQ9H9X7_9NEOP|nr:hypothetical protein PR048_017585 [Dryococelus australis]
MCFTLPGFSAGRVNIRPASQPSPLNSVDYLPTLFNHVRPSDRTRTDPPAPSRAYRCRWPMGATSGGSRELDGPSRSADPGRRKDNLVEAKQTSHGRTIRKGGENRHESHAPTKWRPPPLTSKMLEQPSANQRMVTRPPAEIQANRESFAACSSQSDTRTSHGDSRSLSENGYSHDDRATATPFRICAVTYSAAKPFCWHVHDKLFTNLPHQRVRISGRSDGRELRKRRGEHCVMKYSRVTPTAPDAQTITPARTLQQVWSMSQLPWPVIASPSPPPDLHRPDGQRESGFRTVDLPPKRFILVLTLKYIGATVAEQFACPPPTKAIRAQSPAGSLRIFACGNRAGRCRWLVGLLGDLPIPPPSHSGTAPYSPQSPS